MKTLATFAPLAVVLALVSGCAATTDADDDEVVSSEASELTGVTPDAVVGTKQYGETREVAYTSTPRYRAFVFDGIKGDWLNVTVASSTGSIRAWVTDDRFLEQPRGAVMALRKSGRFYIVVREGELRDATLTVTLKKRTPVTP